MSNQRGHNKQYGEAEISRFFRLRRFHLIVLCHVSETSGTDSPNFWIFGFSIPTNCFGLAKIF
jgi:hypothetical protein